MPHGYNPPSSAKSVGRRFNPLPGFHRTLGFTIFYLSIIVLLPIAVLVLRAAEVPPKKLLEAAFNPQAIAAYEFSIWSSLAAAAVNLVFGSLMAWVIVRYRFPGRRLLDGLIDFPFALPTAVAGLTLANLFSEHGWLGRYLTPLGIHGAYSQLGVIIALTFVGLPFSVRTLQPVLEHFDPLVEEAAASLGAGRLRTFVSVIAPTLMPTMLTGFGLAFARALGEYGSIVFISGNLPDTQIAPMLIVVRLDEYDYAGAMAVALALMVLSFALLYLLNRLQEWSAKFQQS
ncbi:MAG TPA: sulfate ABC transporter permease subunit CysT [Verrucomicrobiae bacterium]|jgi:sulfate transport system permease protein|nr:sulfate ABC transporter permease subunit CysT [Verrucomicrobiae bacterium]